VENDRNKWDQRYLGERHEVPEPEAFLTAHADLLTAGSALDLACGLGGNALFLASCGFSVDAVDISSVALSRLQAAARGRGLDVACVVADLDYFPLPVAHYDLVIVFQFFSVPLISAIKATIKSGGLLIYSTFNIRHTSLKPAFNPKYLIQPEALLTCFSDFRVLLHEPSAGELQNISRIIARSPA
jgi:tellurite methyltransferase